MTGPNAAPILLRGRVRQFFLTAPMPTEPPTNSDLRLARVADGCALAVAALGLAVLAGWLLGSEPLQRVLPHLAAMKCNTALGFLLAGAALFFRGKPAVRLGLAGAVALLGALTLGEIFAGRDFGIDQLFVRDAAGQPPGRMSPATAAGFVLSGAALGLLGARRAGVRWAEALAIGAGTLGFIALLGYALGARNLYSIPGFVSVALHTAAGFAVLAVGLLCAVPGGAVALLLRSRGTGRLLWLGFGVLTVLLMVLGVVSASRLRSIAAQVDALAEVAQPRAVATRELETFLDEMQPETATTFDTRRAATQATLRNTESLTLLLLIGGIVLALVTSGAVARAVLGSREALRLSEERLLLAMDAAQMGSWDWDMLTGEILWTPQHEMLFGYAPGTPRRSYADFQNRLHPDDVERVGAQVRECIGQRTDFHCEFRVVWPDGGTHWLSGFGRFHYDAEGRPRRMLGMIEDITVRKAAEDALHESDERFRAFVTASSDVVYHMSSDWSEMRQLHGRNFIADTKAPSVNWIQEYIYPEDQPQVMAVIHEAIRTKSNFELEHRVRRVDGSVGWTFSRAVPLLNAKGEILEWFGTASDVTARKQTEEEIRQLNSELEQRVAERVVELATKARMLEEKAAELALTSQYKSEFLATMSHELRTPLNSILIFSQQLAANAAGNLTGKQIEFSRHIHSSGTDLLDLITDILDHSKIESGTVTVEVGEIPFAELHGNLDREFRHEAEAKKLQFHLQFAGGLPAVMDSDPKRLRQILKNLLSNAVKFTARGKVGVRVALAARGWRPDHPVLSQAPQVVAFTVEDTGIGIAPEKQQLIFEAFHQADAGTARQYGGTGLGLAISRELAALLGGEIRLASVLGEGSIFALYLPLHYAGPDSARPAPARLPPVARAAPLADVLQPERSEREPLPDAALRGRKVLVVDDDARNIFALTAVLEDEEMAVVIATNGRSAIEIIRQTPDLSLVLMDIMMPGMDGYETMRAIRQAPGFRTLPILALTAKAMPGDREKCLDAGASDYIAKPVNTDQLLALMRNWMAR